MDDAVLVRLTPFSIPESASVIDAAAKPGRSFAPERADEKRNLFEAAAEHARGLLGQGRRVVFAAWSEGSRQRLGQLLADHGLAELRPVA